VKATPEQLTEKRVKKAHGKYVEAKARLDAFTDKHAEIIDKMQDLVDAVNAARSKLERTCRETGMGIGTITVTNIKKPVFNTDYLEALFEDREDILQELITTEKKVDRKLFEQLVVEGTITSEQAKKAVLEYDRSRRLNGVPDEVVMP
jgi:hypothetical protein